MQGRITAVNIVTGQHDGHTYAIAYSDNQRKEACTAIMRWAGNPELNFDYRDAGGMGAAIRNLEMRRGVA